MFHSVNKLPGGRRDKTAEEAAEAQNRTRWRRTLPSETHLKFEWLHIIGAGGEVSVDHGAATEGPAVGVLLQPHAVPLAVAAVQALSVAAWWQETQSKLILSSFSGVFLNCIFYTVYE